MRSSVYRFRMDYLTHYPEFNPLLLFAQKYEFTAGEASPLRRCYAHVVVLNEAGKGMLTLDGKEVRVTPGTLVYIKAGAVHRWEADEREPMVHRCAYFDWKYVSRPHFHYQRNYFVRVDTFKPEMASPSPELNIHEVAQVSQVALWASYFDEMTPPPELLDVRGPIDALQFNGVFQTFLHRYLTFVRKPSPQFDPRIKKMIEAVERLPPDRGEERLYGMAREYGLGKSRFHDLFKKNTGYSPRDYLTRLKFRQATGDLIFSDLTITEIAHKYGYSSIHAFSKAFRTKMGMSPSEYRNTSW